MTTIKISWRNIVSNASSSILSLLLLSVGLSTVMIVIQLESQLNGSFEKNAKGIDLVVGAKGSPLQILLANVYHADLPTGNISLEQANKLGRNPLIQKHIPLAYGDNFQSFRIVGTETTYVDLLEGKLSEGDLWLNNFEVCIGATVARISKLKIGDKFHSNHGLESFELAEEHTSNNFKVTGIFERGGTVLDRLILTTIPSIWEMHEAKLDSAAPKEITALLLKFHSPLGIMQMPRIVNAMPGLQACVPALEVNRLRDLLGNSTDVLQIMGLLILLLAILSIFLSLLRSLEERKSELALMRTMGASKRKIFMLVLQEGMILAVLGFVGAEILSKFGIWLIGNTALGGYAISIDPFAYPELDFALLLFACMIGFVAGLFPAFNAYNQDISTTLSRGK